MCRLRVLVGVWLAFLLPLFGADPFAVMDTSGEELDKQGKAASYGHDDYDPARMFPHIPAERLVWPSGFQATFCDLNASIQPSDAFDGDDFCLQRRLFSAQGDYLSVRMQVFVSRPQSDFRIVPSALRGPVSVPASCVRVFTIVPTRFNPRFTGNCLLMSPRLGRIGAHEKLDLLGMISIPSDLPAGIYHGSFDLLGDGGSQRLAYSLRVMPFQLPEPRGSFGFWVNGNLFDRAVPTLIRRIVQKGFTAANLVRYFQFYRTRGMNSITLCCLFPDLHYVNGKVCGSFPVINRVSQAMKQAGLKRGKILIDTRSMGWWSNAVAWKLAELKGIPAGDLGVTTVSPEVMGQEWEAPWHRRVAEMNALGKAGLAQRIYGETLQLLQAEAKKHGWVDYLLFVEEEVGAPNKGITYEQNMPVLMKICPERALLVNNEIGYGTRKVDRGGRDGIPFRQYNSWTPEALAEARASGATVMLYNYDPARLSFGFLAQSMNAAGNHQWADLWDAWNYQWQYTRLSSEGVMSSLRMEQIHEGIVDYAACEYLRKLVAERRCSGDGELARKGEKVLEDVTAGFPTLGPPARSLCAVMKDSSLEARRWQVYSAIIELKQGKPMTQMRSGTPHIRAYPTRYVTAPSDYSITLKTQGGTISQDAVRLTETFWSANQGPLRHLAKQEGELMGFCSSLEEFKRRFTPSSTNFRVASLEQGLAVHATVNHMQPSPYATKHRDDDGNLWRDDCIELFFELPDHAVCQLIVNAAGQKIFMRDSVMIPSKNITCLTKAPLNHHGGTAFKILVPWSYFGLTQPPFQGTRWKFNVGLEFHTKNETILSWARVNTSFHEKEKWGQLIFSEATDKTAGDDRDQTEPIQVTQVENHTVISGNDLVFWGFCQTQKDRKPTALMLKHADGTEFTLPICEYGEPNLKFMLNTAGMKPGCWSATFKTFGKQGKTAEKLTFTIIPCP